MVVGRRPARLRRRRLARRLRRQRGADAGPREDGPRVLEPALPQRRRRHLHGRHRGRRRRRPRLRPRRRHRRLRQRRRRRHLRGRPAPEHALPQQRRRDLHRRHRARAAWRGPIRSTARCGRSPPPSSTTTATAGSTSSSPTTASGTRRRSRSAATRPRPTTAIPRQYQGLPNSLFHNNGDGTFTDVSAPSGIRAHVGKGMGDRRSPTSTTTAGRTSSCPTTRCRPSCS